MSFCAFSRSLQFVFNITFESTTFICLFHVLATKSSVLVENAMMLDMKAIHMAAGAGNSKHLGFFPLSLPNDLHVSFSLSFPMVSSGALWFVSFDVVCVASTGAFESYQLLPVLKVAWKVLS